MLASFGCVASRDWVIDTIREVDRDLVARVGRLETTAAAEKTRVDQFTTQVGEVRGIATDARNRADAAASAAQSAGQRADAAMARANEGVNKADAVNSRLTQVLANRLKRTEVQQAAVLFELGKSNLSQGGRQTLQGLLKVLADNPTYSADVVGYTDSVGKADYNVNLSWRREEAVRRFLAERGAELNRLAFIGLGEELAGDDAKDTAKRAKNRHVSIVVFKPAD